MKQALLVVSFGTSYNESRRKTIEPIERAVAEQFPSYEFRRAFTSRIIIDILKKRDNICIDGVEEALVKLAAEGFKRVIIQPTLVMGGEEYDCIVDAAKKQKDSFECLVIGAPLLSSEDDYLTLVSILTEDTREYDTDGTEIVFMGHGSEHEANSAYCTLAEILNKKGYTRYHVGTVEADPSFDDVLADLDGHEGKHIVLQPMMIVCGDHAHNDMAGTDRDSWKSRLEADGYHVTCRLKGMGEIEGVRSMFVEHALAAGKKMEDHE
ncbi:sirohydrochlorin cobaltochelatase [Lacrimispora sp.]|uniref:sirohydrochlorin cobaltochelatase n=1 Tax=Lacrimispora sp. TaxID=2719234 RepID=UPI0029E49DB4|nr:sirohydrochlorin cobaltochelatase [Lacrimispora sp.]